MQVLEIAGFIVMIDTHGYQKEIAETIVAHEADYVLALKENHGQLYEDVVKLFADLEDSQFRAYPYSHARTINKGHGGIEIRHC